MKKLLVVLMLLLPTALLADEIKINWNAVAYSYPIHYEVHRNGVYVGETVGLELLLTDLTGNCALSSYFVTAVGTIPDIGEKTSDPSTAIQSMPKPVIASVAFNQQGVHRIMGDNFPADVQVKINGAFIDHETVDRVSCQVVEIPATQGTPGSVSVVNPNLALQNSALETAWDLPGPTSPQGVGFN